MQQTVNEFGETQPALPFEILPVTAVLITREAAWPDALPDASFNETLVVVKCPDVLTRFTTALKAQNEIIYVQDDDCRIDIRQLYSHYNGQITNAITAERQRRYAGTGVTLIGWGCFFPKRFIDFHRWTDRFGAIDPIEADRIFTYLNQPHNNVVMPIQEIDRRVKLSGRPNHDHMCNQLIHKLKTLR